MEALYWLIAIAVLLLVEIMTLGLTTIWFAGGALIAFFIALAQGSLYLQLWAFIIISFILLLFTRPVALKYFNRSREKTNLDALIGREGIVLEEIDNLKGTGKVNLNGQEWTARQEVEKIENASIAIGTTVIVTSVSGVKILVKPKNM